MGFSGNGTHPFGPYNKELADGDTSFIMIAGSLVFLMTPGVAFFYGGLVEHHTVLNTMMMVFACASVVTLQWLLVGYSFAFGPGSEWFGNFEFGSLRGVGAEVYPAYAASVSHYAWVFFQLTFAIVTPALIVGAVIGRMNFKSWLVFVALWTTVVYDLVVHWMWGVYPSGTTTITTGPPSQPIQLEILTFSYGWLKQIGAIDFAGGTVVHMTSGFSALVASILVGKRHSLSQGGRSVEMPPHNVPLVLLGTGLLWFGWFGFNGGSAGNATDGVAALAVLNTQIASSSALLSWMILDSFILENYSAIGAAFGAVVGLVGITPAAGFVSPMSALAIGALSAIAAYYACRLKTRFGFDDSLDAFACHGIGGLTGTLLTGCFANKSYNAESGENGLFYGNPRLLGCQLLACVIVILVSCIGTALILGFLQLIPSLKPRVSEGLEQALDFTTHGLSAYPLSSRRDGGSQLRVVSRSVGGGGGGGGAVVAAPLPSAQQNQNTPPSNNGVAAGSDPSTGSSSGGVRLTGGGDELRRRIPASTAASAPASGGGGGGDVKIHIESTSTIASAPISGPDALPVSIPATDSPQHPTFTYADIQRIEAADLAAASSAAASAHGNGGAGGGGGGISALPSLPPPLPDPVISLSGSAPPPVLPSHLIHDSIAANNDWRLSYRPPSLQQQQHQPQQHRN